MVALLHSEALGCARPSVLSRDRNSFCLCCSASPVPSPGSCDSPALVPIPHVAPSPTPRRALILFWSNVFFLLLVPPFPAHLLANLIIPKLQPHLPHAYPLPSTCIPSVIADLQQTRFALAPAATDWGFPPTRPIPSPFWGCHASPVLLGRSGRS